MASLARQHNDANILCLGGKFFDPEHARRIVDAFLDAKFEGAGMNAVSRNSKFFNRSSSGWLQSIRKLPGRFGLSGSASRKTSS
jgi:hypothetical protein